MASQKGNGALALTYLLRNSKDCFGMNFGNLGKINRAVLLLFWILHGSVSAQTRVAFDVIPTDLLKIGVKEYEKQYIDP